MPRIKYCPIGRYLSRRGLDRIDIYCYDAMRCVRWNWFVEMATRIFCSGKFMLIIFELAEIEIINRFGAGRWCSAIVLLLPATFGNIDSNLCKWWLPSSHRCAVNPSLVQASVTIFGNCELCGNHFSSLIDWFLSLNFICVCVARQNERLKSFACFGGVFILRIFLFVRIAFPANCTSWQLNGLQRLILFDCLFFGN